MNHRVTIDDISRAIRQLTVEPDHPDAEPFDRVAEWLQAEIALRVAQRVIRQAKGPSQPSDTGPPKTKADHIIAMLHRPDGASLDEIAEAFGILPKTARSVISREGRKRMLDIAYVDGRYYVVR